MPPIHKFSLLVLAFVFYAMTTLAQDGEIIPVRFRTQKHFPVIHDPVQLSYADVNGDGQQDIVSCNQYTVSILLNDNGAFNEITNYRPSQMSIFSLAMGDHNGDQKPDIFVATNNDSIAVLTNQGDGLFARTHRYRVGVAPVDMVTADFNNDLRPDLAVITSISPELHIFINNGQGLNAPVKYAITSGSTVRSGDLNGDGNSDLVVTNVDHHTFCSLLNNGNGTFAAPVYTASANQYPAGLDVRDLNQDGRDDIAITYYEKNASIYYSTSGGFDLAPLTISTGTGNGRENLTIADVGGDNKPDIITVDWDHDLVRVYIQGATTFGDAVEYPTGRQPHGLIATDLNGDDNTDVATISLSSIEIFLSEGDGTLLPKKSWGPGYPQDVVSADFNNDEFPDIAAVNLHSASVNVLINHDHGERYERVDYNVGKAPMAIEAADFNGDSHADLVAVNNESNSVTVLTNSGDGTFSSQHYPVGTSPVSVAIGDINNDGRRDLVVVNATQQNISILLNTGNGFDPSFTATSGSSGKVAAGDLNEDGYDDLVLTYNYPAFGFRYMINNGNLTFQPPSNLQTPDLQIAHVVIADINSDDINEIVATTSSQLLVYANSGNAVFTNPQLYTTGASHHNIALGDFNDDSTVDVATSGYGSADLTVHLGKTSGGFVTHTFRVPEAPLSMASANFNQDKKDDLVIAAWPGNYLSVMTSLPTLRITAQDTTRLYGSANPEFKSTIEGIQNNDAIVLTYESADIKSPVGEHLIKPIPGEFATTNYIVFTYDGVLTITPAPLTITADDTTRMFSKPNPVFTGTIEGVKNNDVVEVNYSTPAGMDSPVGEYPIIPIISAGGNNYLPEYVNGVLTITELIVAAETIFDEMDLSPYPNPARGVVTIDYPLEQALQYEIVKSNGTVLSKGELKKGRNQIELHTAGIYFMKFSGGEVKRIVVK